MLSTIQTIVAVTILRTAQIESVEYLQNNAVLQVNLVGKLADDTQIATLFIADEYIHLLVGHQGQSEVIGADVLGFLPVAVLEVITKFMIHCAVLEVNHELEVIADDPKFFTDRLEAFTADNSMIEAALVLDDNDVFRPLTEEEKVGMDDLERELFGSN